MKEAELGEVIELWTEEPRTKTDAREWCEKAGHEFLGVESAEGYERIWVKKAR